MLESIPEISLTVRGNPTKIWLLNEGPVDEFEVYEEWEQNRRFTAKAIYHHPSGVVFYKKNIDDPMGVNEADTDAYVPLPAAPMAYKPGTTYTWVKGDIIGSVAQRLGVTRQELMDHNDIEDPDSIQPGDVLRRPVPSPIKPERPITYEALPEPAPMHVSKPGGAKKWLFGGAKTWNDFKSSGFYPEKTNVTIVAVAKVPVQDSENDEAAYYMDALAFGDYPTTGRVRYTIGYSWSDLAPGHFDRHAAPAPVAEKAIIEEAAKPAPPMKEDVLLAKKVEFADMIAKEAGQHPDKYPNFYKTTYQQLERPMEFTVELPKNCPIDDRTGERFIWIKDCDRKGKDRRLTHNKELTIAGTFEKDDRIYGRWDYDVEMGKWYGVPMDFLESHDYLYNTDVDASTRAEDGSYLTVTEKYFWIPLSKLLMRQVPQYMGALKQKYKTTKKG